MRSADTHVPSFWVICTAAGPSRGAIRVDRFQFSPSYSHELIHPLRSTCWTHRKPTSGTPPASQTQAQWGYFLSQTAVLCFCSLHFLFSFCLGLILIIGLSSEYLEENKPSSCDGLFTGSPKHSNPQTTSHPEQSEEVKKSLSQTAVASPRLRIGPVMCLGWGKTIYSVLKFEDFMDA